MKNKTIHKTLIWRIVFLLLCFLFNNQKIKAQGVDVIFWMDNSSSIDATEWTNMSNNTNSLIDLVLGCNTNNRVSVVHYGGTTTASSSSRVYIESDFTNNATTAKSFVRRGGSAASTLGRYDFAHEALAIIGNALDGVTNTSILSAQKTLSRNSNNNLVIFFFTDAERYDVGSALVNYSNPTGNPFLNYNLFKSNRGATFVVLKALGYPPGMSDSNSAAAAIASRGGSYTGTVESNAGDPQGGSGVAPRKMVYNATFTPSAAELAQIQNDICRSCAPLVAISSITPPTQTVCQNATPQNLVASATGSGTLSYQWYSNTTNSTAGGTPVSGATSASYIPSTSAVGTLYYYVVVTDTACDGTVTSSTVSVTISNTGSCACAAGNTGPNIN